jgi:hypothetical protein
VESLRNSTQVGSSLACKILGREKESEKEGGRERKRRLKKREREREREKEREREVEYVFQLSRIVNFIFKGMTGAFAPFSYLVSKYLIIQLLKYCSSV